MIQVLFRIATIFVFSSSILFAETGKETVNSAEASHAQMLELLKEIHSRTADENSYLGDFHARLNRDRLAKLETNAPLRDRYEILIELALCELDLGKERVAIDHLEEARSIHPLSGLSPFELVNCLFQLAVANLRLGETENCCRDNNPDSCIFPIRGGGIHSNPEGSSKAIGYLESLLERDDIDDNFIANCGWLLNIAHMTLGTWPDSVDERWRINLPEEPSAFPAFPNVASQRGLNRFSLAGGVVADDFNGDGRLDLVISSWETDKDIRYLQQAEDGSFVDYSKEANLTGLSGGLNLIQADYDNDGDLDIYVLRGAWLGAAGNHPNSLLRNEGVNEIGIPNFIDVTFLVGLGERHAPTQVAAWADFDLDGDLDLFVGNESKNDFSNPSNLFRNDNGSFVDIAALAGVENMRFTKGCSWGDYDGDGDPDLYVSNIQGPNRLYRNYGNETFIDVAVGLGVDGPTHSFPSWFWDYDNDGNLDLFASNYASGVTRFWRYYRGERLSAADIPGFFRGTGDGSFLFVPREVDLAIPMMPMGANFGDLNNDGFPDFYLGTGTPNYWDLFPNLLFISDGGERFIDRTVSSRTGNLQKGHGVILADLDADGDLDIFEQMGGAVPGDGYYDVFFENPGFPDTHWLQVRLKGVQTNRCGIGARIRAVLSEEKSVFSHVNSGGSFGANPLIQHLGLGQADHVERLEIFWPVTGKTQVLHDIPADQRILITEGQDGWESF